MRVENIIYIKERAAQQLKNKTTTDQKKLYLLNVRNSPKPNNPFTHMRETT